MLQGYFVGYDSEFGIKRIFHSINPKFAVKLREYTILGPIIT
jgi:hypothetical protein